MATLSFQGHYSRCVSMHADRYAPAPTGPWSPHDVVGGAR
jgi:hypothetical protein